MKSLLKKLLNNHVFANMFMVMILAGGFLGVRSMTRETFPKFSLDAISVSVKYPGADPEEIEEAVCLKLEEAIDGIEGIKEISTTASEGSGAITVTLEHGAVLSTALEEIKNAVDGVTTLPTGAETPIVQELKFRGDVLSIMVWGNLPERQLKEISIKLKDELLQQKGISQASVSGIRDYEISIEISDEMLRKYGLTIQQVSHAIRDNGFNFSAGTLRTPGEEYRIRALGRRYTANEYRNIPIITKEDGAIITLDKLATIEDCFDEDSRIVSKFNGTPAASINVFKTDREDTIKISNLVKKFVERKRTQLPSSVHLTVFRDRANSIQGRIDMLVGNGIAGLCLVFFFLWLFMDFRLSFWVSMGIPISLAGAFALMALNDCSVNMLSLFGMIMVLGLIVDDAIVIGESIYTRRCQGESKLMAAVNGTSEVALPVVAAVLTTIVAFLPLLGVSGVMGKFIRQIPIPVIAALSVSLLEGLFILPVHLSNLPRYDGVIKAKSYNLIGRLREKVSLGLEHFCEKVYGPFIDWVLQWRYAAVCVAIAVALVVLGLVKAGVVKFIFMETSDSDFLKVTVEMASGTPLKETQRVAKLIEQKWEDVEKKFSPEAPAGERIALGIYTLTGGAVSYRRSIKASELEINVELLPSERRQIFSQRLLTAWQEAVGSIPGAVKTNFKTFRGGPQGDPISIEVQGEDYSKILAASDAVLEKIRSYKGTYDQQVNYVAGKREFIIRMKPEAYHHDLTLSSIAAQVVDGFYGNEALSIQRGRDDVKVKVRFPDDVDANSIECFRKIRIQTPSGKRIPLNSVADIKLQQGQSQILRLDRQRVVTVSSDCDQGVANSKEIVTDIVNNFLPLIDEKYDVTCSAGGQTEEENEALGGLYVSFPLALLAIYFIIASMFKSYAQPLIIMTTIPFGLIGSVLGHLVMGKMISLLSMFGMVALAGIVVNDAIVLIENVNFKLEQRLPFLVAIREGSKRRVRAILLTTVTTFSGLFPLMMERSFQAQFLIPMAIAISFGVVFATVLTLVLLPCQFVILNDIRRLFFFVWNHKWATREELEPRVKALSEELNDKS